MTTLLLIALIVADLVLLGLFLLVNRKQQDSNELVRELSEERSLLSELRQNIQEELCFIQSDCRDVLKRVTKIAAETEQELAASTGSIAKEMDQIAENLQEKFSPTLRDLSKKQAAVDATLRKIEREKKLMQKVISRGERIVKFFDKSISYEELVEEMEEQKYADARQLLAQGISPEDIAVELGMKPNEVRILTSFSR